MPSGPHKYDDGTKYDSGHKYDETAEIYTAVSSAVSPTYTAEGITTPAYASETITTLTYQ